jgi:prepilin-type N-terminal cleavage/methylation domain-containing protein
MNNRRAFSLIEMMVVVFVISVGIMSLLTILQKVITQYFGNKNQMLAVVVAQEGVELTRFVRDQNWMWGPEYRFAKSIAYDPGLNADPAEADNKDTIFKIDARVLSDDRALSVEHVYDYGKTGTPCDGNIMTCVRDPRNAVYQFVDSNGRQYYRQRLNNETLTNYTELPFRRLIRTVYHHNPLVNGEEADWIDVQVLVYWQERGQNKFYQLNTVLTNYTKRY